jgi:hypothetical protein
MFFKTQSFIPIKRSNLSEFKMQISFGKIAIMVSVSVVIGCQEPETSRTKTNYTKNASTTSDTASSAFEVNGPINKDTVKGYLVGFAEQYSLTATKEKLFTLPAVRVRKLRFLITSL